MTRFKGTVGDLLDDIYKALGRLEKEGEGWIIVKVGGSPDDIYKALGGWEREEVGCSVIGNKYGSDVWLLYVKRSSSENTSLCYGVDM